MRKTVFHLSLYCFLSCILSCAPNAYSEDVETRSTMPISQSASCTAIVEIPAGSTEKWEMNKDTGRMERDTENGQPRSIHYLGYPANYGYIPQTLLKQENGGDGDPLDVIIIGPQAERGDSLEVKILGVLKLLDSGEQDDKLIALSKKHTLEEVENLDELKAKHPGILSILETWFANYKGTGKMQSQGFGDSEEALGILDEAMLK